MNKFLSEVMTTLRTFAAPAHCTFCLRMIDRPMPLCTLCQAHIRPLASVDLTISKHLSVPVIALGAYEPPLSTLILAKQQRNHVSAHQLGQLLAEHLRDYTVTGDVIIPIPLHWKRYAERGFNQAEIIAREIAPIIGAPVVPLVKRHTHTALQMSNDLTARTTNVADAFSLALDQNPQAYQGKRYLIVDDVMTTGSTVTSVIRTLLPLHPTSITVIVAARVA